MWLVHAYGVTPWKLGGYGMYAVPFPTPPELLLGKPADTTLVPLNLRLMPPADSQAVGRLIGRSQLLGRLVNVDPIAPLLAAQAGGAPFKLAFRRIELSRADGFFRERWSAYFCTAGKTEGALACRPLGQTDHPP
jgi:hypothetical protein